MRYAVMARDERFRLLRRRFARLALAIAGSFLGWYFLYVALSAFARGFMARAIVGNINVALVLGVLQFVSTFALAWCYARYASASLDPVASVLRDEADAPAAIRAGRQRAALHPGEAAEARHPGEAADVPHPGEAADARLPGEAAERHHGEVAEATPLAPAPPPTEAQPVIASRAESRPPAQPPSEEGRAVPVAEATQPLPVVAPHVPEQARNDEADPARGHPEPGAAPEGSDAWSGKAVRPDPGWLG
ncbi:DUF485 domain-containing protein [Actinomadura rupiterrae]|uniref:DUF485 domain-containing protein n=1 Tax=Actinomadura rupiterrae TaxID=559627 RepID=UPI0020A5AF81|nr:DUF485 domain-containing protein [Actinomadura rupiterrae]MCP2337162.1 uncharacterized membrane protein (DUF485 family) [Actinomadura rupiterrae]